MNAAERTAILARRSGSNFYYSFLFLPRRKREAMYALYAFCRSVDDAVDQGGGSPSEQRRILAEWRAELRRAYEGQPTLPIGVAGGGKPHRGGGPAGDRSAAEGLGESGRAQVCAGLAQLVHVFPIPRQHLEAVLDGVEMDIDKRRYATFDELIEYCYRVASAVGLACIEIFGYTDPR